MQDAKSCNASNSYYLDGFWLNGARWVAKHNSIDEIQNNYTHSTKLPVIHMAIQKFDGSKLGAEAVVGKLIKGKNILSGMGKSIKKPNITACNQVLVPMYVMELRNRSHSYMD